MIITALDTETTGLSLKDHEIIQIGWVKLSLDDDGVLTVLEEKEFNATPKHLEKASTTALELNGYTPEKWKNSKDFKEIIPDLEAAMNCDFMLGQNLIFDLKFIDKEYKNYGLPRPEFPKYVDTKYMGSVLVKGGILRSSSIDPMCEHFKIKFKGQAHTALTDCQRTVTLWEILQKYTESEFFSYEEPYDPYGHTTTTT